MGISHAWVVGYPISLEDLNLLIYKLIMSSDDEIVQFIIQILLRKKDTCEYLSVLGNAVRTRYAKGGLKKLFLRHPDHFLLTERYVFVFSSRGVLVRRI